MDLTQNGKHIENKFNDIVSQRYPEYQDMNNEEREVFLEILSEHERNSINIQHILEVGYGVNHIIVLGTQEVNLSKYKNLYELDKKLNNKSYYAGGLLVRLIVNGRVTNGKILGVYDYIVRELESELENALIIMHEGELLKKSKLESYYKIIDKIIGRVLSDHANELEKLDGSYENKRINRFGNPLTEYIIINGKNAKKVSLLNFYWDMQSCAIEEAKFEQLINTIIETAVTRLLTKI